jgi:histidine triad (HIT) family protein
VSECIFCRVAQGEADRSLVHEDDDVVVVMDIQPVNEGHALVLPKRHASELAELDEETGARLFVTAMRTAAALRGSGIRCEGVNVFLADGEAAGQDVDHVHLHVLPRYAGDPFRIDRDGGWLDPQERDELDAVAGRLRAAWNSE